ncbi:MAG: DUF2800 domain-containing protein [Selenomonas sp.]|nr:DUF2800 domain-containing protein [Selenomonas sp.]
MPEHAVCSASSAARWLACPPSARLEQKYPDTTSTSASEGTFAHSLAELELRFYLHEIPDAEYPERRRELTQDKFFSNELVEYVDEYVDTVVEKYNEARVRDKGAALLLEQHVDFSCWVPQGFGRSDAVILADGLMEVIDLKYGRNVRVSAEDNPQLRLYALGAYNELSVLYDIDTVAMTIVQPRNGGESSETLTVETLLKWGEAIKPIAKLAYEGKGEFQAGEHCRFCKAAPRCRKLAEYQAVLLKQEDKQPAELTDEEVADVLRRADGFTSWLNHLKEYALEEARDNGRKWPGFKLVEGRSTNHYTDEAQVAETLMQAGFEDIYKPQELIGITAMKKLLGAKKFKSLLSDYLVKPQGKPTLVPDTDARPELNSVEEDFAEIPF